MKLIINGEEQTFDALSTLSSLVEALAMKSDRVAIELNRDIVSRDRWPETELNDGDRLEIVHFVGGGSASSRIGNSLSHPSAAEFLTRSTGTHA